MKGIFRNWKTTICGLASFFTGVKLIVFGNVVEGLTTLATGLGLTLAKDHNNE